MAWPGRMVGGGLTLNDDHLEWKRSPWAFPIALPLVGPLLAVLMDKGPGRVEFEVHQVLVAPAGRMVPWPFIVFIALTWWGIGLFVSIPIVFLSGWGRRCVAIKAAGEERPYCFAVRDVDGWISELTRAGATPTRSGD